MPTAATIGIFYWRLIKQALCTGNTKPACCWLKQRSCVEHDSHICTCFRVDMMTSLLNNYSDWPAHYRRHVKLLHRHHIVQETVSDSLRHKDICNTTHIKLTHMPQFCREYSQYSCRYWGCCMGIRLESAWSCAVNCQPCVLCVQWQANPVFCLMHHDHAVQRPLDERLLAQNDSQDMMLTLCAHSITHNAYDRSLSTPTVQVNVWIFVTKNGQSDQSLKKPCDLSATFRKIVIRQVLQQLC